MYSCVLLLNLVTAGSYPPAPGAATSLYSWDDRIEVFLF
jgi:hypothetical protein